jgi:hypothetical protein
MLYVLRLSSGGCIVAAAGDEKSARELANKMDLQERETIASIRPLSRFGVRFTPTDSGSLEVDSWDDSTLDDILIHEYPILNQALQKANSVRFVPSPNREKPVLDQLRNAHQQNSEIIRKGLRQEIERLASEPTIQKHKTAHK